MNEEDRSRLEEFRQFRKEVRGSDEYLLVGIDIAKEKHYAFFGTARGKALLRRLVFENNLEGFRKLLGQAAALKVQGGLKKVVFGMGPTGDYALHCFICRTGRFQVLQAITFSLARRPLSVTRPSGVSISK